MAIIMIHNVIEAIGLGLASQIIEPLPNQILILAKLRKKDGRNPLKFGFFRIFYMFDAQTQAAHIKHISCTYKLLKI